MERKESDVAVLPNMTKEESTEKGKKIRRERGPEAEADGQPESTARAANGLCCWDRIKQKKEGNKKKVRRRP